MKKILVILLVLVGFVFVANAESGNYCSQDGARLELYNDGAFQLNIPGDRLYQGKYQISDDGTITFRPRAGEPLRGRFYRAVANRATGQRISQPYVDILGLRLVKGNCR